MKGALDRTKVVLRHLPPAISQSNLVEHVDSRFAGRYGWLAFRPGKTSQKHLMHSRAYINFNRPEDVFEFAEFFNGHVFVNEKGAQSKVIVEYAPSQRIPKQSSKKDGREGTIFKDLEYMEFLEFLAKPVENLPSAEIQLERKEAERAGAPKDAPVVTPLMDYVRQKRAAKGGARRIVINGKSTRRVSGISSRSPVSGSSRKGSGKKKTSTKYVLRDTSKGGSKDKPLGPKQDDRRFTEKAVNTAATGTQTLQAESGGSGSSEIGKKKILLLKGKEKEILKVADGASLQSHVGSPAKNLNSAAALGQNQQRDTGGRIIRSILLKDNHHNQAPAGSVTDLRTQTLNQDRQRKPPRPPSMHSSPKEKSGILEDKVVGEDLPTVQPEKPERRMRNKDRPDRGVWAPLRRSDGSHSSNDSLSSSASQSSHAMEPTEDVKNENMVGRGGENRHIRGGRGSHYSVDNGSYRHGARRISSYNANDADGSFVEGRHLKRGVSPGYASHEKQMWVQKSSSGS